MVFVKNRSSLEDWDSSSYNGKYQEILNGEVEPAKKNNDIKQSLKVMKDLSFSFQTVGEGASYEGATFTQEEVQTTDILGVHHEAFGQNFFDQTKSKLAMDTAAKQNLLYYGKTLQNKDYVYVQEKEEYDLTMLIGWSYAILKWYSEYGKAKGWSEKYKGRNFVKFVANQTPEYFAESDNIKFLFNTNGQTENTVYANENSYIGRNGEGHVVTLPIKRNSNDKDSQLPDVDKYWVPDMVSLQLQGLTPNYSPFGVYDKRYNDIATQAIVNHWWYRRDYWGNNKLLGISPDSWGNVKEGPYRPHELFGLRFRKNSSSGQEMPYSYREAQTCGTAQMVERHDATSTPRNINGVGVWSKEKTWSDQAEELSKSSMHTAKKEFYRYLGDNEPHIHLNFGQPKVWQRNMSLDVEDGGPFNHTVDDSGKKINANQFFDAKNAPLINGDGKDDWELLLAFGRYPRKEYKYCGDMLASLEQSAYKNTTYDWEEFEGDDGLIELIKDPKQFYKKVGEQRCDAPGTAWWEFKWHHAVRTTNYSILSTDRK